MCIIRGRGNTHLEWNPLPAQSHCASARQWLAYAMRLFFSVCYIYPNYLHALALGSAVLVWSFCSLDPLHTKASVCFHYGTRAHEVVLQLKPVRQTQSLCADKNGRTQVFSDVSVEGCTGEQSPTPLHNSSAVAVAASKAFTKTAETKPAVRRSTGFSGAKETPRRQAQVHRVYSSQRQRRTGPCWRSAPLFDTPGRGESTARSRAHDHHACHQPRRSCGCGGRHHRIGWRWG